MADVYPVVRGLYVQFVTGIPSVPHLDISEEEADELVATGAFTREKPKPTPKPPAKPDTDKE